jgi:NADPH:quinone reductase-like Zn-dependent oxidoreductase
MKVMQYRDYGGPEQLQPADVEVPRPAADQLLVRVAAISVNPVDWKLHSGQYRLIMPVKFPSIPGFDIAGEVVEAGGAVTRFRPGARVFGMLDPRRVRGGAAAEYAVVDADACADAPASLALREAAAIPLAGLTALQLLRDLGGIAPGKRVLVVGASGGVGHFAVQIAKHLGGYVTAVCSGANAAAVRALGADAVLDYTRQTDLRGPAPYDVVVDLIARAPLTTFFAAMARDAAYCTSLPSVTRIAAALGLPLVSRRRVRIVGVTARTADLEQLRAWCEAGVLRPLVERSYALAELPAAHARSRSGHTVGKLVVEIAR